MRGVGYLQDGVTMTGGGVPTGRGDYERGGVPSGRGDYDRGWGSFRTG